MKFPKVMLLVMLLALALMAYVNVYIGIALVVVTGLMTHSIKVIACLLTKVL